MQDIIINYWAVLVAGVASMVVGFLWYSQALFGKAWMEASGLTKEKLDEAKRKGMGKTYFVSTILSFVTAYVLAHFMVLLSVTTTGGALQLAFWIWLGFMMPIIAGDVLYGGRTMKLFWVNALYQLVSFLVMGIILALWR